MWLTKNSALAVAIAQNIFYNALISAVVRHTQVVTPALVVAVGPTGLKNLAPSPEVLYALREAYAEAIRRALIVPLVGACGGFPFAWAMQWLNIKRVAEQKRLQEQEGVLASADAPEKTNQKTCEVKEV